MTITTSKGDNFTALIITDATWDQSLIIGFESEIEKLSEIAEKFEDLTFVETDQGAKFFVSMLVNVTRVSDNQYQVRLTKGAE